MTKAPTKYSASYKSAINAASVNDPPDLLLSRLAALAKLLDSNAKLNSADRAGIAKHIQSLLKKLSEPAQKDAGGRRRALKGLVHAAAEIADRKISSWKCDTKKTKVPASVRDRFIDEALEKVCEWFPEEAQPNANQVVKLLQNEDRLRKSR